MEPRRQWNIRRWRPCAEDAQLLAELWADVSPVSLALPLDDPRTALEIVERRMIGLERSIWLSISENGVLGAAALSRAGPPTSGYVRFATRPQFTGRGIGCALVERAIREGRDLGFTELRSSFLESHLRSRRFFEVAGFTETDRLFWSRLDCSIEPPAWTRDRASAVRDAGIEIVTAADFESRRTDWDREWWSHLMTAQRDIPSRVPIGETPFEEWRPTIEPPLVDRNHVLIALDGLHLAGVMKLSSLFEGRVQILQTSVAQAYRRQGISIALKWAAIHNARSRGAREIHTQNHVDNPIFVLNRGFGFEPIDTLVDVAYPLT